MSDVEPISEWAKRNAQDGRTGEPGADVDTSLAGTLDRCAEEAERAFLRRGAVCAHPSTARKNIREVLLSRGKRAANMTEGELAEVAAQTIQELVHICDAQGQDLLRAIVEGNFISCRHAESCPMARSNAFQPKSGTPLLEMLERGIDPAVVAREGDTRVSYFLAEIALLRSKLEAP